MAERRIARGWSDDELRQRLLGITRLRRTSDPDPRFLWSEHHSEAVVAVEEPGEPVPEGAFVRGWRLVESYAFSDPRIVRGHFNRQAPLLRRRMLLEIRVLGLHYLNPVEVVEVRTDHNAGQTACGFRYDTLEGHLERGWEWFILGKDHHTGAIHFRIHACWGAGDLSSGWTRLGFRWLAPRYQRAWHRLAHLRLRRFLGSAQLAPIPPAGQLVRPGAPLPHGAFLPVGRLARHRSPSELSCERETIKPTEAP